MVIVWILLALAAIATPIVLAVRLFRQGKALAKEIGAASRQVREVLDVPAAPAVPQVATIYDPGTRETIRAERRRLRDAKRSRRTHRLTLAAARWHRYGLTGPLPVTMVKRPTGGEK